MELARTKTKKFRGSMTHGKGKKGGRGAGLRGGRGNAGLLKHRYTYMIKNMPDHFGRHGFKRPQGVIKKDKTINVGELEDKFPSKKDIDLEKDSASEKAIEKIKEKGGEVILPELPKEPIVEEEQVEEKIEEK